MPPRTTYQKTLTRLAILLRRKPMTAREIAESLGCCRPSAYQRIEALRAKGLQVYTIPAPEGKDPVTGPRPIAYGIRQ